ncbi:L protein [Varroa jacobsoni rhabdovirus 1]|nr:L protein [Varroa jacobsoni rhabdovirus 1]
MFSLLIDITTYYQAPAIVNLEITIMEDIEEWDNIFDDLEDEHELKIYLERTLTSPIRWFLYTLSLSNELYEKHKHHLSVKCISIIHNMKKIMSLGQKKNIFLTEIIDRPDKIVPFFYAGVPTLKSHLWRMWRSEHRMLIKCAWGNTKIQLNGVGEIKLAQALNCYEACSDINSFEWHMYLWSRILSVIGSIISASCYHFPHLPYDVSKEMDIFTWSPFSNDSTIVFHKDGVFVPLNNIGMFLTREVFYMLSDLAQQYHIIFLTSRLQNNWKYSHIPRASEIMFVLDWGMGVLTRNGRLGYKIIAQYEALIYSALMVLDDGNEDPNCENTFLENILADIESINREEVVKATELYNFLIKLSNKHKLSELFGLFRLWGHPNVYGREGTQKIKEVGNKSKYIDPKAVDQVTCSWVKMFIKSYIKRHNHWPPCYIDLPDSHYFHICYKLGTFPSEQHIETTIGAWLKIKFKKIFSPNDKISLAEMMEDKSCSPLLCELTNTYASRKSVGLAEQKRLILKWLDSPDIAPHEFLREKDIKGFTRNELIIGQVAKERELKLEPRMFSLMTFPVRLYFVLTEAMIAKSILPYFKQITITYKDLELKKRLINLTRDQARSPGKNKCTYVTINMDFEKWNHNMRNKLVKPIFERLDQLFGFNNLITRTHDIFKQSTYYLAEDGTELDFNVNGDLSENMCAYKGTKGGQEGLRQKGWTLVTVAAIHTVISNTPHSFQLSGQGDNQVIILAIHDPPCSNFDDAERARFVRAEIALIRDRLAVFFNKVGLPLKTAETWTSSILFAYGKKLLRMGVLLTMFLKRVSRTFAFSNEKLPSLESDISSIWANAAASAEFDFFPFNTLMIGSYQTGLAVINHLEFSPILEIGLLQACLDNGTFGTNHKRGKIVISAHLIQSLLIQNLERVLFGILIRPKILGGYPISLLDELTIKGIPDPLTSGLHQLKRMLQYANDWQTLIIKRALNPLLSQYIKPIMLYQDPLSINIISPPSGEAVLKDISTKAVRTMAIKNKTIRECLRYDDSELVELGHSLWACEPQYPFLMSDILSSSLVGYQKELTAKCSQTTTMRARAAKSVLSTESYRIKKYERTSFLQTLWSQHLTEPFDHFNVNCDCSRKSAELIRTAGWGRPLVGVTVPSPFEVLISKEDGRSCQNRKSGDYIQVIVSPDIYNNWDCFERCGPFSPYLGSETKDKTHSYQNSVSYVVESVARKAIKLTRAIGWFTDPNSPLGRAILRLTRSVTDIPVENFTTVLENHSGSPFHRYNGGRNTRIGRYNLNQQPCTYMSINTDQLSEFSKGSQNTTIHFQTLMLSAQVRVLYEMAYFALTGERKKILDFHFHINCRDCIEYISNDFIEGDDKWNSVKFKSCPDNYYLFQSLEQSRIENIKSVIEHELCQASSLTVSEKRSLSAISLGSIILRDRELSQTDINDNNALIPWVWLAYLSPTVILEGIVMFSLAKAIILITKDYHYLAKIPSTVVYQKAAEIIEKCDLSNFAILSNLFIDEQSKHRLLKSKYRIRIPSETVPKRASYARAIQNNCCLILAKLASTAKLPWMSPSLIMVNKYLTAFDALSLHLVNILVLEGHLPRDKIIFLLDFLHTHDLSLLLEVTGGLYLKMLNISLDSLIRMLPRLPEITEEASKKNIKLPTNFCNTHRKSMLYNTQYGKICIRYPTPITGAVYKYLDILNKSIDKFLGNKVFVIGDGTGGISSLLSALGKKVYYQTLISYDQITQNALGTIVPSAYSYLNITVKPENCGEFVGFINDITNAEFGPSWLKTLLGAEVESIISDAEGTVWSSPESTKRALETFYFFMMRLSSLKFVVIKMYNLTESSYTEIKREVVNMRWECGIYGSRFSNCNTEVFLICRKDSNWPQVIIDNNSSNNLERELNKALRISSYWPCECVTMKFRKFFLEIYNLDDNSYDLLFQELPNELKGYAGNLNLDVPRLLACLLERTIMNFTKHVGNWGCTTDRKKTLRDPKVRKIIYTAASLYLAFIAFTPNDVCEIVKKIDKLAEKITAVIYLIKGKGYLSLTTDSFLKRSKKLLQVPLFKHREHLRIKRIYRLVGALLIEKHTIRLSSFTPTCLTVEPSKLKQKGRWLMIDENFNFYFPGMDNNCMMLPSVLRTFYPGDVGFNQETNVNLILGYSDSEDSAPEDEIN